MKRWTLRILICLILGAITTVAVAWGGVLNLSFRSETGNPPGYSDHPAFQTTSDSQAEFFDYPVQMRGSDLNRWRHDISDGWPDYPNMAERYDGQIVTRHSLYGGMVGIYSTTGRESEAELREMFDGWGEFGIASVASGFPMRAVEGECWSSEPYANDLFPTTSGHDGILLDQHFIPLRPIWPGFLIDTLFYATIWGGVSFGFTSAKRFVRIRRGRCPRCGYDLRGGVMSDKRLAMSGEAESANCKPQASGLRTSLGCPECGWGRAEESSPKG